jgi:DNA invertase Pin-like site-specific DNA recombinase
MKIAIWARVSSQEQDASTQLEALRTLAAQLGGDIVYEYVLNESATGKRGRRKEFDLMMQDAARRRFDLLLFYNLSRFSREGVRKTIHYLERLDSHGVRFKSMQEPLLDTDNEMIRYVVLAMLSYLAEYQAQQISEATRCKLESLKAQGVKLGRPSKYQTLRPQLRILAQDDSLSTAEIGRRLGISYNSTKTYLKRLEREEKP